MIFHLRSKDCFQTDSQLGEQGGTSIPPSSPPEVKLVFDHQFVAFGGQTRYDWDSFDPLLVAEAAFALGNVLTFGRLLQTLVIVSGRLGVLQISLTGMVEDIIKFLILFFMTWISFTLGMTQLYRPFEELDLQECRQLQSFCPMPPFIRFVQYHLLSIIQS